MLSPCQSQDILHLRRGSCGHKTESHQQAAYTHCAPRRTRAYHAARERDQAQIQNQLLDIYL